MSAYVDAIDALATDLRQTVEGIISLPDDHIHLYAPWNPENFSAQPGERHMGIWMVNDTPMPMATLASEIMQEYAICVWEDASLESGRRMADVDAARDFLDLAARIRDRFFTVGNQTIAGASLAQYMGTEFVGEPGSIRWFRVAVRLTVPQPIV